VEDKVELAENSLGTAIIDWCDKEIERLNKKFEEL
jgi:hypothetical protein